MNGSRDSTEALMDEARSADCGARARGGGTRRHAIPQYSAAPRRPQRSEGSAGEGAHWVRHAVRSGGGAGEEWGWVHTKCVTYVTEWWVVRMWACVEGHFTLAAS